jgi:O-antigen ligase
MMLIYVVASLSFLAIFSFAAFVTVFAATKFWRYRKSPRLLLLALVVVLVALCSVAMYFQKISAFTMVEEEHVGLFKGKFQQLLKGQIPANIQERLDIWNLYLGRIGESAPTFILGHSEPVPRDIWSSAHNWYLDMIDSFGLISVLPMLALIAYTVYFLWDRRRSLPVELVWLGAIVFVLVLVDNNVKVTLRQPYPGIFSYFLWGLFLSGLAGRNQRASVS